MKVKHDFVPQAAALLGNYDRITVEILASALYDAYMQGEIDTLIWVRDRIDLEPTELPQAPLER